MCVCVCVCAQFMSKFLYAHKPSIRDGQNHHILMILKSKSNHLNIGDLKSKSKLF